jgi:hypothetical protein
LRPERRRATLRETVPEPAMRAIPLVLCLIAAAPLPAQESAVRLIDHGVLCDVTIEGRREAPLTESGVINLIDQGREMDVTTADVPARMGLSFGIRVVATGGSGFPDARVVVTHPPLGAAGVTVQSWPSPLGGGATSINLFTFEHAYELVQGVWRFQIVSDGRVLAEQAFAVTGGHAVPEVQTACFAAEITS